MDYNEYLEFLNEKISVLPDIHQKAVFNQIRKVDKWIQLTGETKGWAVNLSDGLLIFAFNPDGDGKVYFEWDLIIKDESEIPAAFTEHADLVAYFTLPPEFSIKKAK